MKQPINMLPGMAKESAEQPPTLYRVFAYWPDFGSKSISSVMPRDKAEHLAAQLAEQGAESSLVEDTMPDSAVVTAQANRIRDLVSEVNRLEPLIGRLATAESIERGLRADLAGASREAAKVPDLVNRIIRFQEKQSFLAIALGFFGRGPSLEIALAQLKKAGCGNDQPVAVDLFIGDDKPCLVNGGLNVEFQPGTLRIEIARFKSLGAAFRNLRLP